MLYIIIEIRIGCFINQLVFDLCRIESVVNDEGSKEDHSKHEHDHDHSHHHDHHHHDEHDHMRGRPIFDLKNAISACYYVKTTTIQHLNFLLCL